jgi:NAD(P)H dehydrogenase (quinone)
MQSIKHRHTGGGRLKTKDGFMAVYTIMGITGNVGTTAATKLLADGSEVRAIVRREEKAAAWRARGAQVVVGNPYDGDTLKTAFDGVDGIFIMTPTWFESEDMFAENTAALKALNEALRAVPPTKVVLLSSIGAQHSHGTGAILKLHHMERAFADLPAVTSIRAGWFMENYAGLITSVRETGVLPSMLNPLDREVPMIATADIGTTVAAVLQADWRGQRIVELEGPRRYSPHDIAAALATVLGRPVTAQVQPETQWLSTYRSWGLTSRSADAMAEMLNGFNTGWIVFERPATETTRGGTSLETALAGMISKSSA